MPASGTASKAGSPQGESVHRLRLDLSYDGTDFHGWAAQPGQRTVEGELTAALMKILRQPVSLTVAGRTDAGVHARGQVVQLDLDAETLAALPGRSDRHPTDALITRLGGVLPRDVVVHAVREVPADFDARFSALWRRYRYRISDSPRVHDPMRRDVLRHRRPLDVAAMAEASRALYGEHDFLSYCRPREGASTVRTLHEFIWERPGQGRADEGLVVATVVADAFCHHMVRSLVGALMAVGEGRADAQWPARILAARTREPAPRTQSGPKPGGAAPMAPPEGLTLDHVAYPPDHLLAEQAQRARVLREPSAGGPST